MENPSSTKCILRLHLLLLSRIVQDDFSRLPTSAANILNHVTNTDALAVRRHKENASETIQLLIQYPATQSRILSRQMWDQCVLCLGLQWACSQTISHVWFSTDQAGIFPEASGLHADLKLSRCSPGSSFKSCPQAKDVNVAGRGIPQYVESNFTAWN